jgi:hypothetical protein
VSIDDEEHWQKDRKKHNPQPLDRAMDLFGFRQPHGKRLAGFVEKGSEQQPYQPL